MNSTFIRAVSVVSLFLLPHLANADTPDRAFGWADGVDIDLNHLRHDSPDTGMPIPLSMEMFESPSMTAVESDRGARPEAAGKKDYSHVVIDEVKVIKLNVVPATATDSPADVSENLTPPVRLVEARNMAETIDTPLTESEFAAILEAMKPSGEAR